MIREVLFIARAKKFSLRIVKLYCAMPKTVEGQVLGKQILRSGTSVGAQLHEGKRSRSRAELISKNSGALQELEETIYWLDLIGDSGVMKPQALEKLAAEAEELLSILVASINTLKFQR